MKNMKCFNCGHVFEEYEVFCPACGIKKEAYLVDEKTRLVQLARKAEEEVGGVIRGKSDIIRKVLSALFASGHILLEDNPGTGKTTLAKTIARVIELDYKRQQFTPDTMPSDIIGYTWYDKQQDAMSYMPGAVQCNLLLADEINRTSAKTQAALLEAMEEKTVTMDGETRALPDPFFVIATQNPSTSMGTMALPDSQCDRFMVRLSMGYPGAESEIAILMNSSVGDITKRAEQIVSKDDLRSICRTVDGIHANDAICMYIQRLVGATRLDPMVEVGVSTRGAISLLRMAKASAFMAGRDYAVPQDVKENFLPVCAHRIVLSAKARMEDIDEYQVLNRILNSVPAKSMVA